MRISKELIAWLKQHSLALSVRYVPEAYYVTVQEFNGKWRAEISDVGDDNRPHRRLTHAEYRKRADHAITAVVRAFCKTHDVAPPRNVSR